MLALFLAAVSCGGALDTSQDDAKPATPGGSTTSPGLEPAPSPSSGGGFVATATPKEASPRSRAELQAMCEQATRTSVRQASSDAAELLKRVSGVFFACNGSTDIARILEASDASRVGVDFDVESLRAFAARESAGALVPLRCLECGTPWSIASAEQVMVAGRPFDVRFGGDDGVVFLREGASDPTSREIPLVHAYR